MYWGRFPGGSDIQGKTEGMQGLEGRGRPRGRSPGGYGVGVWGVGVSSSGRTHRNYLNYAEIVSFYSKGHTGNEVRVEF